MVWSVYEDSWLGGRAQTCCKCKNRIRKIVHVIMKKRMAVSKVWFIVLMLDTANYDHYDLELAE